MPIGTPGRILCATLVVLLTAALAGAEPATVWLEGEQPSAANFEFQRWGGEVPAILSGGEWLNHILSAEQLKALPEDFKGFTLRYDLQAPAADTYTLWARVGYEFLRPPIQWRIDGGKWQTLRPDVQTTNLMRVALWAEVAWVELGQVELSDGKHTLELRYRRPGPDGRMLIGLDCLALVAGPFTPDGPLRPGEGYDAAIDRAAAEQVFRFAADRPASPERAAVTLSGPWQVARYDDPDMDADTYAALDALPAPDAYALRWRGLEVPGDARGRPELVFGHRLLYRTRVDVPAELQGRSFTLHFSATNWIVGVFVNGQFVGGHTSVLVPWDIDVTRFVRPGEVNEITLSVKSSWYGLDAEYPNPSASLDHIRNTPYDDDVAKRRYYVDAIYPSSKGEGDGRRVGILAPVTLTAAGPVYTADVFVRTSVAAGRLDADVTASNPTDAEQAIEIQCEAVNLQTGEVEKTFSPVVLTVPAGGQATATVSGPWPDAKLWWPEPNAQLYALRTSLVKDRGVLDVHEQTFGFREVGQEGIAITLNGVPWHFWNWAGLGKTDGPEDWLAKYHATNNRYHRIAADDDPGLGYREAILEFLDRNGVPGRLSTCIDGMFITHHLPSERVWQNFARHVEQVVRAYRNHPSVIHYSLGNELMFITARLRYGNQYGLWTRKANELHQLAKRLDPTRASFQDGGGDLGGLGEVNCQHYSWPRGGDCPAGLYEYDLRPADWVRPEGDDAKWNYYRWDGQRPLVQGEVFYYSGNLSDMAWVGGPDVFRGKSYADRAAATFARMGIEGARWQGVAGICPWTGPLEEALVSFEPRAVFVRQYNSAFAPGGAVTRTLKVFNDGRFDEPLTLRWRVVLEGETVADGEKTYTVAPGHAEADELTFTLPDADTRRDGELVLELYAGDERVFADRKPVSVVPVPAGAIEGLDAEGLAVFDPLGSVTGWLEGRGQPFTALESLDTLPDLARVVLVGAGALTKDNRSAVAEALRAFTLAGGTAIVLEQDTPLEGDDLPVPGITIASKRKRGAPPIRPEFAGATGESGAFSFPVAPAHAVFTGLAERDFFTWAGDERSFYNSYGTPAGGAVSLVQAGSDLSLAPLLEVPTGQGGYLLCQMLVGAKLAAEPTAEALLVNALTWAAGRASAEPARTVAWLGGDEKLAELLDGLALQYAPADSLDALLAGEADILIVRASPEALAYLVANAEAVEAFTDRGGWLVLAGLDEAGLAHFNRLVGFEHRIRPSRREAVTLAARNDELLLGLTDRDVSMESDEMLAPWRNLRWISDRVFSAVVDGRQIASFADFADAGLFKIANGLTDEDFWQYIHYFPADGADVELPYDRPETFTGLTIWSNPSYYFIQDLAVLFDGDQATAQRFTLEPRIGPQELDVEPRQASKVTLRILSHHPGQSSQQLVGIDNVALYRQLPEGFDERVVLLTHPGGLVKYPRGAGGVLLNQVDYARPDTDANRAKKQALYANLLRNLGAGFRLAE